MARALRRRLSAQLNAQRPLRIGVVADLVRWALDAHLHPLRRDNRTVRSSYVSDRRTIAARATVVWSPVAAVAIAAVMMLIDFWYGHMIWYRLVDASGVGGQVTAAWYRSEGSAWVRFFPFEELYDLALHLAMLAVALAGALLFAVIARKAAFSSLASSSFQAPAMSLRFARACNTTVEALLGPAQRPPLAEQLLLGLEPSAAAVIVDLVDLLKSPERRPRGRRRRAG